METYIKPTQRSSSEKLSTEIKMICDSNVMSNVLHLTSGLLVILDEHRHIVAMIDSFIKLLGISDPAESLGMRPGEALECLHAHGTQDGCGTSAYCSSCGAALAIVASLQDDQPAERICALKRKHGDNEEELALVVRAHPLKVNDERFLLVFLYDITLQQQRAMLERTFFHDINNIISGLLGANELLTLRQGESTTTTVINQLTHRLKTEIEIQRSLFSGNEISLKPCFRNVEVGGIVEELRVFFTNHSCTKNKVLTIEPFEKDIVCITDSTLVLKVLTNMLLNAFEASNDTAEIKLRIDTDASTVTFRVWNPGVIAHDVQLRIFQRYFSTKKGEGRGMGTYSIKFFGETILRGKVDFTSSEEDGTEFSFSLPVK